MKNKSYADYIVETVPVEIRREWGTALKEVYNRMKELEMIEESEEGDSNERN